MYEIKNINDKTFYPDYENNGDLEYKIRNAARGIMFDENGNIPMLYASKDNYYKLPWWWIDIGEDKIDALKREFIEEVWAIIEINDELWLTIETKDQEKMIQYSYVYTWRVNSILWEPQFTEKEINDWLQLKWMSLGEAVDKIKNTIPNSYIGNFIRTRDLSILEYLVSLNGDN